MDNNIVLNANNLHKKFTKNLRRSMIYGVTELFSGFLGKSPKTTELRKSEFWALKNINLKLSRGQILGVIGPNGSGKTTLLRLLAGIYPPDIGSISIQGRTAALISLGAGFHPQLTGSENIFLKGTMLGMSKKEVQLKKNQIIEFSELENFIHTPVSNYSSGMKVRLGFSIATASNPDLLLLDEVLAVGDRQFKAKCFQKIDELSENAGTVFVTHNMNIVSRICTDIIVLDKGEIIYEGNNVSEGIDYYYTKFRLDESNTIGQSTIKLEKISIGKPGSMDKANSNEIVIDHDEDVEINMILNSSEPLSTKAFTIRIIFFTNNFLPIAELNSKPIQFEKSKDKLFVNANISKLEFSPGRYSISVEIYDSESGKMLIRHQAIKYFSIKGDFISRALVHKKAKWRIKNND